MVEYGALRNGTRCCVAMVVRRSTRAKLNCAALTATIVFLNLVFGLAEARAAADAGGRPEKTELVLAYPQASGVFTPIFVADEAGLFKKYGLDVKMQQLNPQLSVQSVVSGSADVSVAAGDLVNASLQGARIKLVGSSMSQLVFQLWAAKEITSVPQLKGKMLAGTTPRSVLEIATREALKKHGLNFATDYKLIYMQSVPAVLTAIASGKAAAGALSAPTTLKAKDAGLNMLVDIAKLNVPGLPLAYGFTENFIKENPNTVSAFLRAVAEGVARTKSDPAAAKRAIGKFTKTEDGKVLDDTYDFYAPYFVASLALKPEQLTTWFSYLDDKEYPQAANAKPSDFYDNSFVAALEKSGFFEKLGVSK
jgi:NitT/TauT family transport system substrate-binding protein